MWSAPETGHFLFCGGSHRAAGQPAVQEEKCTYVNCGSVKARLSFIHGLACVEAKSYEKGRD